MLGIFVHVLGRYSMQGSDRVAFLAHQEASVVSDAQIRSTVVGMYTQSTASSLYGTEHPAHMLSLTDPQAESLIHVWRISW